MLSNAANPPAPGTRNVSSCALSGAVDPTKLKVTGIDLCVVKTTCPYRGTGRGVDVTVEGYRAKSSAKNCISTNLGLV